MGRQLQRSSSNKVIAGVVGGLARRFDVDTTLIRVAYVCVSILSAAFPGLIVYIVLWVVMPKDSYLDA
ncbi:PspC domain-containing protein [soil metagenome]